MADLKAMGVVGGDGRQIALAESLVSGGFEVYACGFDRVRFANGVRKASLDEVAERCDVVILPLPVTDDGKTLKTDYGEDKIVLDDGFAGKMRGKRVFGGMMQRLYRTSGIWQEIEADDYYTLRRKAPSGSPCGIFPRRSAAAAAWWPGSAGSGRSSRTCCGASARR